MKKGMCVTWCVGLLGLWGCGGPVISKELRQEAAPITGLAEVRQNPEGFKNRTVIVGGEDPPTFNHANETTTLVVLDCPFGRRGSRTSRARARALHGEECRNSCGPGGLCKGQGGDGGWRREGMKVAPHRKDCDFCGMLWSRRARYTSGPGNTTFLRMRPPSPLPLLGLWRLGPTRVGPGFDEGGEGLEGEGRGEGGETGRRRRRTCRGGGGGRFFALPRRGVTDGSLLRTTLGDAGRPARGGARRIGHPLRFRLGAQHVVSGERRVHRRLFLRPSTRVIGQPDWLASYTEAQSSRGPGRWSPGSGGGGLTIDGPSFAPDGLWLGFFASVGVFRDLFMPSTWVTSEVPTPGRHGSGHGTSDAAASAG